MDTLLRINRINKSFGGVVAAKDITFDVTKGKIHGLIGPNGAGKSTLMNMISGLLTPDSGDIFLKGERITHLPAYTRARKGIGRTFQTPRFLSHVNIDVNLRLGTDLAEHTQGYIKSFFSRRKGAFERDLEMLTSDIGFSFVMADEISSFTYGQLKLLEIVRALLAHPCVILVDEPAAGLNDKETDQVVALLQMATTKFGIGVLLIEHDMGLIMNICEEIVVINFGQMIAQGSPREVSTNQDVIAAYLGRDINADR